MDCAPHQHRTNDFRIHRHYINGGATLWSFSDSPTSVLWYDCWMYCLRSSAKSVDILLCFVFLVYGTTFFATAEIAQQYEYHESVYFSDHRTGVVLHMPDSCLCPTSIFPTR